MTLTFLAFQTFKKTKVSHIFSPLNKWVDVFIAAEIKTFWKKKLKKKILKKTLCCEIVREKEKKVWVKGLSWEGWED